MNIWLADETYNLGDGTKDLKYILGDPLLKYLRIISSMESCSLILEPVRDHHSTLL